MKQNYFYGESMVRGTMTFNLDTYLIEWLRTKGNASGYLNELLKKVYGIDVDEFVTVDDARIELIKLEQEKKDLIKDIDKKMLMIQGIIKQLEEQTKE